MYTITTLTASLLALLFIIMSIQIIKLRRLYKVSLGSSGYEDLERAIRAHGNFTEYVPITLILLICAEAYKANWILLLSLAVLFILGRILHAYAFIVNNQHFKFRVYGMALTFTVLISLAILNIGLVVFKFTYLN